MSVMAELLDLQFWNSAPCSMHLHISPPTFPPVERWYTVESGLMSLLISDEPRTAITFGLSHLSLCISIISVFHDLQTTWYEPSGTSTSQPLASRLALNSPSLMLRRYLVLQQSGSTHDAADHSTLMEAQNVEDAANRPWNIMNGTTFNLDDSAFELSTTNLVRPVSIFKLESAAEMVQAENDPALTYTNLQGESSGRHKDSPPNLTDDEMVHQLLLAQANGRKEYQEILLYMYCENLGSDDNEPVPVDDFDEENVKDAVEMIAEDHGSLIDQ